MHKNNMGLNGLKNEFGFLYTLGKWSLLAASPTMLIGYAAIKCSPAILKAASSEKAMGAYCQVGKKVLKTTGRLTRFAGRMISKGVSKGYNYMRNRDWSKVKSHMISMGERISDSISNPNKENEIIVNNDFEITQPFQMDDIENNNVFENEYNDTFSMEECQKQYRIALEEYNSILEQLNYTREDDFIETDWDMTANNEETIENISLDRHTDVHFTRDAVGTTRKYMVYNGKMGNPQVVEDDKYSVACEQARRIATEIDSVSSDISANMNCFEKQNLLNSITIDDSMEVQFRQDDNGNINKYYCINGVPGNPEVVSHNEYNSFLNHASRIVADREVESLDRENLDIEDSELSI